MTYSISGSPEPLFAVKDDPGEVVDPVYPPAPPFTQTWRWNNINTDGGALTGGLEGKEWCITIDAAFPAIGGLTPGRILFWEYLPPNAAPVPLNLEEQDDGTLTGSVTLCCRRVIEVPVDIKPESCPNALNVKRKGLMSVAVVGTPTFDVTQVDPLSLTLAGVPIVLLDEPFEFEDVATPQLPFVGKEDCDDCNELGPDGILDLTVKFDNQEVIQALETLFGTLEDGQCLVVPLEGFLKQGTPPPRIIGEDVVLIIKRGQ
jgi:hypothetical protein